MTSPQHKGLFVVFEGGEGSGKSTQARLLSESLSLHDIPNCLTREPGDTVLGAKLRAMLLDREADPISRRTEALLFAADRAEHVEKVILPALNRGEVVVCDRYIASTMAYQAYGGDLEPDGVQMVSDWASDGLRADVTYFLDVDPAIGLERAKRNHRTRFEDKSVSYHENVRRGFRRQRNDSWITIDGHDSIEVMHDKIFEHTIHLVNVLERVTNRMTPAPLKVYEPSGWAMEMYNRGIQALAPQPAITPKVVPEVRCPECDGMMLPSLDQPDVYQCHNPFHIRVNVSGTKLSKSSI